MNEVLSEPGQLLARRDRIIVWRIAFVDAFGQVSPFSASVPVR